MKKILIIGSPLIIGQIRFACALAGLTAAQAMPAELIPRIEEHHQEPCEVELAFNDLKSILTPGPTMDDIKAMGAQLMAIGRSTELESRLPMVLPPNVPQTMGKPLPAKGSGPAFQRKVLRCNRR